MKHLILTLALLAPLALAACDNKDNESNTQTGMVDVPAVAPAAGDETPASETGANEGIAVGEPNPSAPETPSCGDHASWVGKNKADIQSELDALSVPVRVLYPDSPATMDYNPERINVILEKDTDVVSEVRCG